MAEKHENLSFDEERRDLICDLADTLRELDNPVTAEEYLRIEIKRRDENCSPSLSGRGRLELSLAEALFAQSRFGEVEQLCLAVQSYPSLFKFEKLRLHVTLAKLCHLASDYNGASRHWADAMVAVSKYPNENCATRIIVLSVCDILKRQSAPSSNDMLLDQSQQHLRHLDAREKPGGFRCWIAGMRHWAEYLSRDISTSRL
ncbi:hypothetical protein F5Y08DRAFT_349637 [Xylaria arbuscula]|nr:hypothetical protein F5Y08DRAFT_349637 [Xylaria arbuscula]